VLKLLLRLFVLKVIWDRWRGNPQMQTSPERLLPPPQDGTRAPTEPEIPTQKKGGPGPDTPLELSQSDWRVTLKRTGKEIKADRVPFMAAAMAYYFFLAIFPALIAVVGIMGLVDADTTSLIDSIESTLPGESGQAITEAFREADKPSDATSLTSAILGIAIALWSASSGMVALQTGLNIAYDVEQDRKFFAKRGLALLLIVATALLGGVPSPIFTFGESTVFVVLGWVLTIVAVMILFSIYYYFGPNRESPTWHWVSAGGVVGALLWIIVSVAFGWYVESYSNYSKTYGSLAGVIVLILLLYLTSLAVLIGGELNAELERRSAERTSGRQPKTA
jgi:membrane protein